MDKVAKKKKEEEEELADEMIEIEYMLANMNTQKPDTGQQQTPTVRECSDTVQCQERRNVERKREASLLFAIGIEADLPAEFYEKLAKSRRAKMLLKTVLDDAETAALIRQLYK